MIESLKPEVINGGVSATGYGVLAAIRLDDVSSLMQVILLGATTVLTLITLYSTVAKMVRRRRNHKNNHNKGKHP